MPEYERHLGLWILTEGALTDMRVIDIFFIYQGDRSITIYPLMAKILGGLKPTVFLTNLIQWIRADNRGMEIYKTAEEIEAETSLTSEPEWLEDIEWLNSLVK